MAYTAEDSLEIKARWAWLDKYGAEEPANVFYLDHDPAAAARAHCDRHVVKMILETAQLLSAAWHVVAPKMVESGWFPPQGDVRPGNDPVGWHAFRLAGQRIYAPSHLNHPCAVWARASTGNYEWLWRLGMELCAEYTHRYGKRHATEPILWTLEAMPPRLPQGPQTEPPTAMPEELQVVVDGYVDAVLSYRNYYLEAKTQLLKWSKREPPEWVIKEPA